MKSSQYSYYSASSHCSPYSLSSQDSWYSFSTFLKAFQLLLWNSGCTSTCCCFHPSRRRCIFSLSPYFPLSAIAEYATADTVYYICFHFVFLQTFSLKERNREPGSRTRGKRKSGTESRLQNATTLLFLPALQNQLLQALDRHSPQTFP